MDKELRKAINNFAENVIRVFNIEIPIQDMNEVVRNLGGRLQEDENIGSFSDGKIDRSENGYAFSIKIPKRQPSNRKNFTVAHELGHLFLHMGYLTNEEEWKKTATTTFYRKGNSELELQASEFAAAFLMPKEQYKQAIEQYSENNYVYISKVAQHFNVSIDAATIRGKWLGYFEW